MGCPGHSRHWFTQFGAPSVRLPRCPRCGAPNPRWAKQRVEMIVMLGVDEVVAIEHEMEAANHG